MSSVFCILHSVFCILYSVFCDLYSVCYWHVICMRCHLIFHLYSTALRCVGCESLHSWHAVKCCQSLVYSTTLKVLCSVWKSYVFYCMSSMYTLTPYSPTIHRTERHVPRSSSIIRVECQKVWYVVLYGIACILSHPTHLCAQDGLACATKLKHHVCRASKSLICFTVWHRMYILTPYTLVCAGRSGTCQKAQEISM